VQALNDAATTAADLAVIAEMHPALHPQIARHPAAYEGLLVWMANLGNPDVISVAQARLAGTTGTGNLSDNHQVTQPAPQATRQLNPQPKPKRPKFALVGVAAGVAALAMGGLSALP